MNLKTVQAVIAGLALASGTAWAQLDRERIDRGAPPIEPAPDVQRQIETAPPPAEIAHVRPNLRDEDLTTQELQQVNENERRLPRAVALNAEERESVRAELRAYTREKGKDKYVRDTLVAAVRSGCNGPCIADAVHALNRGRAQGLSDKDSAKLVNDSLFDLKRERDRARESLSAKQIGERLQARMDQRVAEKTAKVKKDAEKLQQGIGGSGLDEAKPKQKK